MSDSDKNGRHRRLMPGEVVHLRSPKRRAPLKMRTLDPGHIVRTTYWVRLATAWSAAATEIADALDACFEENMDASGCVSQARDAGSEKLQLLVSGLGMIGHPADRKFLRGRWDYACPLPRLS